MLSTTCWPLIWMMESVCKESNVELLNVLMEHGSNLSQTYLFSASLRQNDCQMPPIACRLKRSLLLSASLRSPSSEKIQKKHPLRQPQLSGSVVSFSDSTRRPVRPSGPHNRNEPALLPNPYKAAPFSNGIPMTILDHFNTLQSPLQDVAAGQFLEAVHFVPGFFGVPAEFGGHEGADAGGGGHA